MATPAPGADEVFWQTIKDEGSQSLFDEFLKKYPSSSRALDARGRLQDLKNKQAAMVVPPAVPHSSDDPCGRGLVTALPSTQVACPLPHEIVPV